MRDPCSVKRIKPPGTLAYECPIVVRNHKPADYEVEALFAQFGSRS